MRAILFVLLTGALAMGAVCDVKKPGPGGSPVPCDDVAVCDEGACVTDPEEPGRICALACGADVRCLDGFACVDTDEGASCLSTTGTRATGDECAEDRECSSGACAADEDGDLFCVDRCDGDGGCPRPEQVCYIDRLRRVCLLPVDEPAPLGAPCAHPQECTSALCLDVPGDDAAEVCADPCVLDDDPCTAEQVCAPTEFGGRVCLAPLDDGDVCRVDAMCTGGRCVYDADGSRTSICASPCEAGRACGAGFFCVDDEDGDPVCVPLTDDRTAGEPCDSGRECENGVCRHFDPDGAGPEDLGTLCADPCGVDGACPTDEVCWEGDDGDVCGPTPPP